jgi:hypothetical protein
MSGIEGSIDAPGRQALVTRVKGMILSPSTEWQVIDGEPTTVGQLYRSYIIPLSAIPPIASFIGYAVFGISLPLIGTFRIPMGTALTSAVTQYVLGLVAVYALALIIDALAPTFGGQKSQIQALKVAAYSSTAAWLAGIFALIPGLRLLGILGIYSLFLLYLGLPVLTKSPKDKALGYTVVVIICAIVIFWIVGAIAGSFITRPSLGNFGNLG